jgi:glycosyltransferase involved in cell wall biosynthesis
LEAFGELDPKGIELIIVGPEGWSQEVKSSKNVRWLGYVVDEKLQVLYSSCLFFVYPSIWEGFGYPVLEAMAHGAPVATSNTSSLREIGGKAALLFDPLKVEEIKSALQKMISSEKLRKELSQKGLQRAKDFTWKKYYDVMIKALW